MEPVIVADTKSHSKSAPKTKKGYKDETGEVSEMVEEAKEKSVGKASKLSPKLIHEVIRRDGEEETGQTVPVAVLVRHRSRYPHQLFNCRQGDAAHPPSGYGLEATS